jgi:hypothetical protein
MDSIKDDFDVYKPLPSVIVIKCAVNHLYSIGLSLFSFGSQTRNRFHNPFFISFIICVQILRSLIALLMKREKYRLLLIGDFACFLNDRYFMNVATILWGILALFSQIIHYWKYYKNEIPSYLKPFQMISGLVSPKSIGLINREHIIELLKKSKLMFKVSKLLTFGPTFTAFCISFTPLIINSSFHFILISIFWALLFTSYAYLSININFSQMTFFYIICMYLKLKLRNANNSIRKSFDKKYKMNNNRMNNILNSLSSIISEINTYNNDLWAKYLMIVLVSVILVLDLSLFESLFGKMSLFFKILMLYFSGIIFVLLIILINTASSVSFEANKSYKLLNKLFITNNKKQISIHIKIKV